MKKIITIIVCVLSLILTVGCEKKTKSTTTSKKNIESSSTTTVSNNTSSKSTTSSNVVTNGTTTTKTSTTTTTEVVISTTTTKKVEPVYQIIDEDHLYLGSYPQSIVEDETLLDTLNTKYADKSAWSTFENYWYGVDEDTTYKYIDVVEGDNKYRGYSYEYGRAYCIGEDSTNIGSFYEYDDVDGVYWFKWEPIKWRILNNSGSNKDSYFLVAELILDSQNYDFNDGQNTYSHEGEEGYASDYKLSYIRKWLINDFYNLAFNAKEKEIILTTRVDNSQPTLNYPNTNQYGSNEVLEDKVFLLSYEDICNGYYFALEDDLKAEATDYAKVNGGTYYTDIYDCWWLRSPEGADQVTIVDAYAYAYGVNTLLLNGVRPAIYIDIA